MQHLFLLSASIKRLHPTIERNPRSERNGSHWLLGLSERTALIKLRRRCRKLIIVSLHSLFFRTPSRVSPIESDRRCFVKRCRSERTYFLETISTWKGSLMLCTTTPIVTPICWAVSFMRVRFGARERETTCFLPHFRARPPLFSSRV